jgi:DNA topoisomerase-1
VIKEFDNGIKILNGPYGPYITDGKKNTPVPKTKKPATLTAKSSKEILEKAPIHKGFRRHRRSNKAKVS